MLFQYVSKALHICVANPEGIFRSMYFIDKYFRVQFQVLAQMYLIEDFPELVLYVGSFRDPAGIL